MANLASNPWSLVSADVVSFTPAVSPGGLVLNANGTVTITTTGANTFTQVQQVTVINATNALYNGFYDILSITSTTVFIAKPVFNIPVGTAGSGGGTVALNLYNANIRVEDMSIQGLTGAVAANVDLRDRMGNIVWQANIAAGQQNRGKVFWINGLTPIAIPANTVVLITVN